MLKAFSPLVLTILGSIQYVSIILGAPQQLVISGTSLMIIVTVSIETIQQIEGNIFDRFHKIIDDYLEEVKLWLLKIRT